MLKQIGLIGLGKMGFPLAQNMTEQGFEVTAFDLNAESRALIEKTGVKTVDSAEKLPAALSDRKVIWMMIPAGRLIDETIAKLTPLLAPGDILIDGGNSNFKDTVRRSNELKTKGIDYIDCGTSGGTEGARHGACAMIGGDPAAYAYCEALFESLTVKDGCLYCGKSGSGHYVKMVHNGVEYGMMQAIAEGFEMLERSEFDLDHEAVAKVWNNGSVIRGWLMELIQNAFSKDAKLDAIKGVMHSSGEGQWTVETAIENGIATPVIALSLMMRYRSQVENTFSGKVVAALRNEFGGHAVEKS